MATKIEVELFRDFGTHGVKSITLEESRIKIILAPWSDLENQITAVFHDVQLSSIEAENDEPVGLELPWDIIAIDCKKVSNSKWFFCIRCTHIEFVFRSQWPIIKK